MITEHCTGRDCCGCGACADACPKRCIRMTPDGEGFLRPVVDEGACIRCGRCEDVCPFLHRDETGRHDLREAWAAVLRDRETLFKSSSGGLFTALALEVLGRGGCVFGAAFTEDCRSVRHIMAESPEQLALLRGSKYLQSDTGGCFAQARDRLKDGRQVLFTGTPCQIMGFRRFLGRDYDTLFLTDVICHGVPSAALWQRCLDHVEQKNGGRTASVNFRQKSEGWYRYGTEIVSTDGKRYFRRMAESPFMKMFIRDFCLRESCYQCPAKQAGAASDLTIGDFWGVERILPGLDSNMGVSLALIHSEKGRELFERASKGMIRQQTDYGEAAARNGALIHSAARPAARDDFYGDLGRLSWKEMEKKYAGDPLKTVVRQRISDSFVGRLRRKLGGG